MALVPASGQMGYIALTGLAINALIGAVATAVLDAAGVRRGHDETVKADYFVDEGDPRMEKRREATATVRL